MHRLIGLKFDTPVRYGSSRAAEVLQFTSGKIQHGGYGGWRPN